jgi:hypothetical protein
LVALAKGTTTLMCFLEKIAAIFSAHTEVLLYITPCEINPLYRIGLFDIH